MATQERPKMTENKRYEIPESENIWEAPYLEKTQIFPSYVKINKYNLKKNLENSTRLSNTSNEKRFYSEIFRAFNSSK